MDPAAGFLQPRPDALGRRDEHPRFGGSAACQGPKLLPERERPLVLTPENVPEVGSIMKVHMP